MTIQETAQLELAAVLFITVGAALGLLSRWLIRRHRWPAPETLAMAFILALGAAAYALADAEPGKPAPPQVRKWMRFKKDWARWTHEVQAEWAEFCAAVRQGLISVQGLYGGVIVITNTMPENASPPKAMRLRANILANPNNQNLKARPTRLTDNGDGTWTVEITASREITDEPALMMYLRRRSDGAVWWVEHTSSSFPETTAPNAYAYTFEMPAGVEGHLAIADEVMLGGPGGLTVEGLALVDLDAGAIYEGISGDFIDADGRLLQVRRGVFMIDNAKAQSAEGPEPEPMMAGGRQAGPEPLLNAKGAAATATPALRGGGTPREAVIVREPEPVKFEPPLKLAMPPLDGGAR